METISFHTQKSTLVIGQDDCSWPRSSRPSIERLATGCAVWPPQRWYAKRTWNNKSHVRARLTRVQVSIDVMSNNHFPLRKTSILPWFIWSREKTKVNIWDLSTRSIVHNARQCVKSSVSWWPNSKTRSCRNTRNKQLEVVKRLARWITPPTHQYEWLTNCVETVDQHCFLWFAIN